MRPAKSSHPSIQLKVITFLILNSAEDEESQQRGMVGLLYHVGSMPIAGFDRELFYRGPSSVYWLPIKMVGLHYCFDDPVIRAVVAFTMMSVGRDVRLKFRLHDGKTQILRLVVPMSHLLGYMLFLTPFSPRHPHRMPVQPNDIRNTH
jgi:hypothetical protein